MALSTPAATTPDLAAVKERQQATWASGDFSEVATTIVLVSERLADETDLRAGSRVLDVATGSGNAAIAAARWAARSPAATTSPPCSSAAASAPPPSV